MTDFTELKRLAEAATPGPWYQHGGIMQVLSHDCETVCETFEDDGECPDAQFIAAANPAAVLALIAENERLAADEQEAADLCDRLSDLLRNTAIEVRGPEEPKSRHGFHDLPSRVKTVVAERDQLKADNEELRANSSLVVLLPELDSVLEDLEIHGQHSDQGYRKLKDWYRKVDLACKAIDAAMGNGEQP